MSQIEGVLNIDKPASLTSHDVVNRVRKLTGMRRVGHTGTLDPLATGILVLCIGRATRLSEYIMGQNKTYHATIRLGQETDTYDSDGKIVAECPVNVSLTDLQVALSHFEGAITQIPPMFSAIKVRGQPLYQLARQGIITERKARMVFIKRLEILSWRPPELSLRIDCSSGTYIRSIAHDLGQRLDCGGHLTKLTRTAVGQFSVRDSVKLAELNAQNWQSYLLPPEAAINHLPKRTFSTEEAVALSHGQRVPNYDKQTYAQPVGAFDTEGTFIGIILAESDEWQPHKIFYQDKEG